MKHTQETKEKIREYILMGITSDDVELVTPSQKLKYAFDRFKSEYWHEIKRFGFQTALKNWLMGLALDYDFMNHEILKLAEEWGQPTKTEAQQDKILEGWYDFLAWQLVMTYKYYENKVYVCKIPPTNEQGSHKLICRTFGDKNYKRDALDSYNSAREHDGQQPINRLPKGTTFKKVLGGVYL